MYRFKNEFAPFTALCKKYRNVHMRVCFCSLFQLIALVDDTSIIHIFRKEREPNTYSTLETANIIISNSL